MQSTACGRDDLFVKMDICKDDDPQRTCPLLHSKNMVTLPKSPFLYTFVYSLITCVFSVPLWRICGRLFPAFILRVFGFKSKHYFIGFDGIFLRCNINQSLIFAFLTRVINREHAVVCLLYLLHNHLKGFPCCSDREVADKFWVCLFYCIHGFPPPKKFSQNLLFLVVQLG